MAQLPNTIAFRPKLGAPPLFGYELSAGAISIVQLGGPQAALLHLDTSTTSVKLLRPDSNAGATPVGATRWLLPPAQSPSHMLESYLCLGQLDKSTTWSCGSLQLSTSLEFPVWTDPPVVATITL